MMMVFVYRPGKVEQAITEARAQGRGMLKIAMPVVAGDWEDTVAAHKADPANHARPLALKWP